MPHPPCFAVAIAGALVIAIAVEAYQGAARPTAVLTATTMTPAQQLDRALQALRADATRDDASPM